MKPGDLSESNLVKPADYSLLFNILAHALAFIGGLVISGILIFLIFNFGDKLSSVLGVNNLTVVSCPMIFIAFLISGALFSFLWNKSGWKLGLSLGSSAAVAFGLLSLYLFLFQGLKISFQEIPIYFIITLPALAGGCLGSYFGASCKKRQRLNNSVI
jgi:hypothetical protein